MQVSFAVSAVSLLNNHSAAENAGSVLTSADGAGGKKTPINAPLRKLLYIN